MVVAVVAVAYGVAIRAEVAGEFSACRECDGIAAGVAVPFAVEAPAVADRVAV